MSFTLKMAAEKPEAAPPKRKRERTKEKEAFAASASETAQALEASKPLGARRRILVVDDNPVVLKAFELKLQSLGFDVHTTANAANVASIADSCKAELIVLDINFPASGAMEWNGFTILQWVRRFPELARIPVIFVTGAEAGKYREQALAAGAADFFEKPVDFQLLLKSILEIFERSKDPARSPAENAAGGAH
ncbi:MAG TPA: response regulator [Verrucomicrobiae bacterium]|nr:response regulator [Verrucomicrobiae bacterium]